MLRALHKAGWEELRQSGSHVQLRHPFRPGRVTVPSHGNAILHPKTLRSILTQAGMSIDELRELI
jgi:predicted RNA binding protein YcfA (HicA-like mRNA interferase family)